MLVYREDCGGISGYFKHELSEFRHLCLFFTLSPLGNKIAGISLRFQSGILENGWLNLKFKDKNEKLQ